MKMIEKIQFPNCEKFDLQRKLRHLKPVINYESRALASITVLILSEVALTVYDLNGLVIVKDKTFWQLYMSETGWEIYKKYSFVSS